MTLSVPQMRMVSFGDEVDGAMGAQSGSVGGGASISTLALIMASLCFISER